MNTPSFTIAGIGELLWDVFPHHQRLGGAPTNFACHCRQLGANAFPVSCIGTDVLGARARETLRELKVPVDHLQENDTFPTGTVEVSLNEHGKPSYRIPDDVAWDHIPFTGELKALALKLDAVCFGSLSQRSAESRDTIQAFLRTMRADALKIFDVNLRLDFFSREIIESSLELATVLKLSDEELPVLAGIYDLRGSELDQLKSLRDRHGLKLVAYTRGPAGSLLVGADRVDDAPGLPGIAVDSVGAGDSFTASLCLGLLKGWKLDQVNQFANQVATFVCSQQGATPVLPAHLRGCRMNAPWE
jgi:fructokinase